MKKKSQKTVNRPKIRPKSLSKKRIRVQSTPSTEEFNYNAVKRHKSIVILGAGPSLTTNADRVKRYISANKSLVISSNYNFINTLGIKSNYTYLTDEEKLLSNIKNIQTPLLLAAAIVNHKTARFIRFFKRRAKLPVYKVGMHSGPHAYEGRGLIPMHLNGSFLNKSLGIAGLGAILSSMVFRPKRLLIVGIDDPTPGKGYKIMYDGKRINYKKEKKCLRIIDYFQRRVLPTLRSKKIQIYTYSDVNFFGLDKNKLKFNILS